MDALCPSMERLPVPAWHLAARPVPDKPLTPIHGIPTAAAAEEEQDSVCPRRRCTAPCLTHRCPE